MILKELVINIMILEYNIILEEYLNHNKNYNLNFIKNLKNI